MERRNSPLINVIPKLKHAEGNGFLLVAGPCVVEGREMALEIAGHIHGLCQKYHIPFVFKASYRKANRSRLDSFTGIGDEKA
jgi:2-dehydro-3-deoxyphosphooctonate aldolase (KDO 8-P synthase)